MMNLHTLDLSACLPRGAWRRQAVPTQADTIHPGKIRALFGLTPVALSQLLEAVLPVMIERRQQAQASRPDRKRRVGGGRKRRLRPYQEVLMSLLYLRHNVSHALVGQLFGVSADTSENTFHEVVPILQAVCPTQRFDGEKKWKKSDPSWHPDEVDRVLIDSFETPICRPSVDHRQRQVYSGKRKRHTIKTQVATDKKGEILSVDAGHRGPKADIRVYEESGVDSQFPNADKLGDKGYQSQAHPQIISPHKKPKGGELTSEQRLENRQIAQQRIYVEHSIRRIKGWRILREDYRLGAGLFPMIAGAVVGLVQLDRILG
jgi:hypothetical protein